MKFPMLLKNLFRYKQYLFQVIFFSVMPILFLLFSPVIIYGLIHFPLKFELQSILGFILLLCLLLFILIAVYILMDMNVRIIKDFSKEFITKEYTVKSKSTQRGRSATVYYIKIERYKNKFIFNGGAYRFRKLKKGQNYKLILLKNSGLIFPSK